MEVFCTAVFFYEILINFSQSDVVEMPLYLGYNNPTK